MLIANSEKIKPTTPVMIRVVSRVRPMVSATGCMNSNILF